jgi:protease-4
MEENNNQARQTQPSYQTNHTYIPVQPPQKKSKAGIWIVSISAIILLFACACSFFVVFVASLPDFGSEFTVDSNIRVEENTVQRIGEPSGFSPSSKIAVIEIAGVINFSSQTDTILDTNNKTVIAQLRKAQNDSAVKAIILRFNTPGGAVSAADPICDAIKEIDSQKPIYSFIDTEGASLGYLLPNCSRMIFSRPDAITGSIGVRADLLDLTGILTNLGARSGTITNSKGNQKTQDGLFTPGSEAYKRYQSILDEIYESFVQRVWEGRQKQNNGLTLSQLRGYADGQIFSGQQAFERGLVDKIGQYNDVIDYVVEKNNLAREGVDVVEYTISQDPFLGIFGSASELIKLLTSERHSRQKLEFMLIADY